MAQKHRRGNRELKKPKQDKAKVSAPATPYAVTLASPVKVAMAGKRK